MQYYIMQYYVVLRSV